MDTLAPPLTHTQTPHAKNVSILKKSEYKNRRDLETRLRSIERFLKMTLALNKTQDQTESLKIIETFFARHEQLDGFALFLDSQNGVGMEIYTSFGENLLLPVSRFLHGENRDSGNHSSNLLPGSMNFEPNLLVPITVEPSATSTLMICPLFLEPGVFLGMMVLLRNRPQAFESSEIALMSQIGQFIAFHFKKVRLFESTQALAFTDALTGIFNRRYFDQRYQREIQRAQRYRRSLSVLMIDIDFFKKYNDLYGHLMGDDALRRVARLLEDNLRKVDIICRYGGEEFSVVLPEINADQAVQVAEKLRKAMIEIKFPGEDQLPHHYLTISVGVASFPQNGKSSEEVLLNADRALYTAKRNGRNQIAIARQPE